MSRLTDNRFLTEGFYQPKSKEERKEILKMEKPTYEEIYNRLGEYENRESHGKWLFIDIDGDWYNQCSVCNARTENHTGYPPDFNHCPYCGAKMDLQKVIKNYKKLLTNKQGCGNIYSWMGHT